MFHILQLWGWEFLRIINLKHPGEGVDVLLASLCVVVVLTRLVGDRYHRSHNHDLQNNSQFDCFIPQPEAAAASVKLGSA